MKTMMTSSIFIAKSSVKRRISKGHLKNDQFQENFFHFIFYLKRGKKIIVINCYSKRFQSKIQNDFNRKFKTIMSEINANYPVK